MITNYNKFVNEEMNEGLFTSLKNMFLKLMKNVSDELKKPVDELTKKLDNSKNIKYSKKLLNDYLRIHNENLKTTLDNSDTPNKIVKSVEDNLIVIYGALDASTKSLGENYTFEQMFGDSPGNIQKLFDNNEKKFNKNVKGFSKNLVLSLGKQFGIDEKNFTNEEEVVENKPTEKEVENKPTENVEQTTDVKKNENKLYEEIEKKQLSPEQQTEVIEDAQNVTDQDKKPEEKPEEKPEVQENKEEDQNLINLKGAIIKWFQNFIYKPVENDLKKDKSKNKEQAGSLEDKIKNMESTENKGSVNNIMNKITQIDKDILKKVRDLLGLTKEDTPL